MTSDLILTELSEARQVLNNFLANPANIEAIEKAAGIMAEALKKGGKILSCGNGGSMCDAMHFAEELSGRYRENRKALAALSLSDSAHISCVANDYGYDYVFSRGVEAFGREGDVLLAISTSGNSRNVLLAAEAARELGMKVISLTGKDGGKLAPLSDVEIRVEHFGYADRIQEVHIKVIHIFMLLIEKQLA
ncbi:D-sedoheptulose 7-phosphate isomerase [Adhaeribacter soli]|uniref:Phosphoheptose isomerase n=1 Tax=Adhaeribacter soli TaxID=2607655 RepID=A0A5N1IK80_9BACT|nr:D-sedoheptulose 7-phosphate isomerase [Adhaeribacter soli]